MSKKQQTFTNLKELSNILSDEQANEISQEKYQKDWKSKKYAHWKMVAKRNRRWLIENSESKLKEYTPFPDVYNKIMSYFDDDGKRKYIIHVITNFFPLNRTEQVVLLRESNPTCPFTNFKLTDTSSLMIGNRDKHIAFSGANSNVFICGIALQELNRLVMEHTYDFDSRVGQIINYALDELRFKMTKKRK